MKIQKKNKLIVQRTSEDDKKIFPQAQAGKFNGEYQFGCLSKDTLKLYDLKTGSIERIFDVAAFSFSAEHNYTAVVVKTDGQLLLEIRNKTGNIIHRQSGITSYAFDAESSGVVVSAGNGKSSKVEAIFFKNQIIKKGLAASTTAPFKKLLWKTGSISFIENHEGQCKMYYYNINHDKLSVLDSNVTAGFPVGMYLSDAALSNSVNTSDGAKIIVWIKEKPDSSRVIDQKKVEIWNTKDKRLHSARKYLIDYKMADKMVLWNVEKNTAFQITDKEFPKGFLSAGYNYAFVYDPLAYEPQSIQYTPYDLYMVNLQTGRRKLIIRNYTMNKKPFGSPDGANLCYAHKGQWWIYNTAGDAHIPITKADSGFFDAEDNNRPEEDSPYGFGGWTTDGEVILYDRFDLWRISRDGKSRKRLTRGRESQKIYRIKLFTSDPANSNIESNKGVIDLKKGFLLETLNRETMSSDLSYWNIKSGAVQMVSEDKKISQVQKAADKDIYMYVDQSFESAPRLMVYDRHPKVVFQSNPQQGDFYWARCEKIEFTVDSIKTKGILYYPADYAKGKKYPMVVNIYERQFFYINDYINPSMTESVGFNVHNYTSNGYFVLMPDINYEYGNLKKSVTRSVLAGVDEVIAKGIVDPAKIGLNGHSFGGYETNLILTQTGRFAAAVSGAAITDLISSYLYVGPLLGKPDFFRAEHQQFRIGKSLYADMQSYINNSPVLLAPSVSTPLLGWAGENDRQVHTYQSMEFYLAMRRLNKEHILLIYPGEEHELADPENAIDLNTRILQWFNYYLKNGKKYSWFSEYYR